MTAFLPASVSSSFDYDYSVLGSERASFVRQRTEDILKLERETKGLFEKASDNCVTIGKWIVEIKERLDHGEFENWKKTFFPKKRGRTLQLYMSIAKNPKSEIISDLGIPYTVNTHLSRLSTPESAVLEVIDLVERGEKVTVERTKKIISKHKSTSTRIKGEKNSSKSKPSASEAEIIDAEIEEPPQRMTQLLKGDSGARHPQQQKQTIQPSSPAPETEQIHQPQKTKALLDSPPSVWWRLNGLKESKQTHLLFLGSPEAEEFLSQLPDRIGIWLSYPPTPSQWHSPPSQWLNSPTKWIGTTLSLSTNYQGINLNIVRQTIESFVKELTSQRDGKAMIASLSDAPLLALLDDFELDCHVAEPDEAQCHKILTAWKLLGGTVEKLDKLESKTV